MFRAFFLNNGLGSTPTTLFMIPRFSNLESIQGLLENCYLHWPALKFTKELTHMAFSAPN